MALAQRPRPALWARCLRDTGSQEKTLPSVAYSYILIRAQARWHDAGVVDLYACATSSRAQTMEARKVCMHARNGTPRHDRDVHDALATPFYVAAAVCEPPGDRPFARTAFVKPMPAFTV